MRSPFHKASYLAQVRRLRALAKVAICRYPIKVREINLIHHGENTTFRVDAKNNRRYLLRVHRNEYHTKPAIQEELNWLSFLSQRNLSVPNPVTSKAGQLVETVAHPDIETSRNCTVFHWINGKFLRDSIAPEHLYQVGQIIADLQTNTPRSKTTNRRYWTADGLVGNAPKFGSIDMIAGLRPKQQEVITRARKSALKKLRQFEKRFPKRQGLIHADLHFGNILSTGDRLAAIDFDDCGFGFHAYDLVIPLLSVEAILSDMAKDRLSEFKSALVSGYSAKRSWDHHDEKILPVLITARKLLMLGWLNSRSDNPRLRKRMARAIERTLIHLKQSPE